MKICILLFLSICYSAHSIPGNLPSTPLVSTAKTNFTDSKVQKEPRMVITFMTNMRTFATNNKNDSAPNNNNKTSLLPFVMDPFQWLLQYLFAPFAQEISRSESVAFQESNNGSNKDIESSLASSSAFLNAPKEITHGRRNSTPSDEERCLHGELGFCKRCVEASFAMRRGAATASLTTNSDDQLISPNKQQQQQMNATKRTASTKAHQGGKKNKHRRHYFLSISGGTDKSVTAQSSELLSRRVKRLAAPKKKQQQQQQHQKKAASSVNDTGSIYKIISDRIQRIADARNIPTLNLSDSFINSLIKLSRREIPMISDDANNIADEENKMESMGTPPDVPSDNSEAAASEAAESASESASERASEPEEPALEPASESSPESAESVSEPVSEPAKPASETAAEKTMTTVTSYENFIKYKYTTRSGKDYDEDERHILPQDVRWIDHWQKIFTITLPIAITSGVILIAMCVCLRTRGWCCHLFLTDPIMNMQRRAMKHLAKAPTQQQGQGTATAH